MSYLFLILAVLTLGIFIAWLCFSHDIENTVPVIIFELVLVLLAVVTLVCSGIKRHEQRKELAGSIAVYTEEAVDE